MRQSSFREVAFSFASTRGGIIVLCVVWAFACRLATAPLDALDFGILLLIGFLWPWLEWIAHKYFMHEWTAIPFYKSHERHHLNPTPANGMPDAWVLVMYYINPVIFYLAGLERLSTANVAVIAMLALYEFAHYSCHVNYRPLTRWGWRIRVNHLKHHRFDESRFMSLLFPSRRAK